MLKKIMIVILFLLTLNGLNATDVELNAYVYEDYTILNYIFTFENETSQEISFEKVFDASIDYIVDQYGPIKYSIENENLILQPQKVDNNTIIVKLRSQELSKQILSTESFRTYQKFNFDVDKFNFKVILKNNFGEVISVFPNNHTITNGNKIEWEVENDRNSLYIVNFKQEIINVEKEKDNTFLYVSIIMIAFILICIVILIVFYKNFIHSSNKKIIKSDIKSEHKDKIKKIDNKDKNFRTVIEKDIVADKHDIADISDNNEDNNYSNDVYVDNLSDKGDADIEQESQRVEKKINKIEKKEKVTEDKAKEEVSNIAQESDVVKEIIEKYLTENEKNIVQIIKEHEGIQQNEILNYIPSLTKSNLSKIVSKLHAKRILNRIKVGKTNNIYLGEKLTGDDNLKKDSIDLN